jgi:hypothetical protein
MVGEATEMRRHIIVRVLATVLAAAAPALLAAPALAGPAPVIGGTGPSTDGGITWVVAGGITWVNGDA